MDEKKTEYVPPKIETVDGEQVVAELGPATAWGSGGHNHNHNHGGCGQGGHGGGGGSWG